MKKANAVYAEETIPSLQVVQSLLHKARQTVKDNIMTQEAMLGAASAEQSQGIDQVNTAVNQMDKVTQQNAADAEESASASEESSAQAEQMNENPVAVAAVGAGDSNL